MPGHLRGEDVGVLGLVQVQRREGAARQRRRERAEAVEQFVHLAPQHAVAAPGILAPGPEQIERCHRGSSSFAPTRRSARDTRAGVSTRSPAVKLLCCARAAPLVPSASPCSPGSRRFGCSERAASMRGGSQQERGQPAAVAARDGIARREADPVRRPARAHDLLAGRLPLRAADLRRRGRAPAGGCLRLRALVRRASTSSRSTTTPRGSRRRSGRETQRSIRECNARNLDPAQPDLVAFVGWEWTQTGPTPETHYGHRNVVLRGPRAGGGAGAADLSRVAERREQPRRGFVCEPRARGGALRSRRRALRRDGGPLRRDRGRARVRARASTCASCRRLPRVHAPRPASCSRSSTSGASPSLVIPHGLAWGIHAPPGATFAPSSAARSTIRRASA